MAIKKLHIENFRSFKELDLELDAFNVVIGANASGKSNFIEIFRFLRDIARDGLENAVSLQGGTKYLQNLSLNKSRLTNIAISFESSLKIGGPYKGGMLYGDYGEITVGFTLEKNREEGKITYINDIVTSKIDITYAEGVSEIGLQPETIPNKLKTTGTSEVEVQKDREGIIKSSRLPEFIVDLDWDLTSYFTHTFDREGVNKGDFSKLFLEIHPFNELVFDGKLLIYDFHPSITKKDAPKRGKVNLDEDGSNQAIALNRILSDEKEKRRFLNYVNYLLPFVDDVKVEQDFDGSYITEVKESYFEDKYLPSYMLSDGTINVLSFITVLFFDYFRFVIIEEPERHLHPALIPRLMKLIHEASEDKQIIVTTHSPELLKYTPIPNMLFVRRNEDGFSEIIRPEESEAVKTFLENEIGIDELFVQNFIDF